MNGHILVVDDNPINLKLASEILLASGYTVAEAADAEHAQVLLAAMLPDLILMDISLPGMDGLTLTRLIKADARLRHVPIVALTAFAMPGDDRKAAEAGCDGYITKPIDTRRFVEQVSAILHSARARRDETRHSEVQDALTKLQTSHEHIIELNRMLETRVAQRTAALDAASKELEGFSFSVSHDLRAPLRRISGFAQLLQESASAQLDQGNRELLAHIIGGATQMSALIDALLEFSRAGRAELHIGAVDLESVVDGVISELQTGLAARGIEWRRGALPTVRGDRVLLQQVLANLLSNAVKYTRTRNPAVIEIGVHEGRDNEVVVFVRDNGVGFDLRYAGRLFEVFQRMHRVDEFEGTGIGLANARRIVTRHGGTIWADATIGSGAWFYFSLPCS
jgi:signal transduction histidine kinase